MDMLDEVNIAAPPLAPFDGEAQGVDEYGEEHDGENDEGEENASEDEEVVEVEANGKKSEEKKRQQLHGDRRCNVVPGLGRRGDGCGLRHRSNREAVLATHRR